jgi:hypothetical protein
MKLSLSLYHVIAISTVVSVSLVWVYWKVNKLEKHLKDVNARVSSNTSTLNNLCTSLELAKSVNSEIQRSYSDAQVSAQNCSGSPAISDDDIQSVLDDLDQQEEGPSDVEAADAEAEADADANADADAAHTVALEASDASADDDADADVDASAADAADAILDAVANGDVDESYKELLLPHNWIFSEDELKKKTVEELKQYLSSKQLSIKGVKKELIQRILEQNDK